MLYRIIRLAISLLVILIPILIIQDCVARDALVDEINRTWRK